MEIPPYPPSDDDDIECNRCGGCLIERDHARSNCPGPWTIPELLTALEEARGEVERLHGVLQRVSDIRDSIVGMHGFNFSEHAYPLVAVLNGAGFKGKGYEISRANLGTLIEQRDEARADRDRLLVVVARLLEYGEAAMTDEDWAQLRALAGGGK